MLVAGAIIAMLGAWLGARIATGVPLIPPGLFAPSPPGDIDIEYPTVMSARAMAQARGDEHPGEVMPPPEGEAPFKSPEETDLL